MFKVDQKRGGILKATCVGDLPRNALQASRIRCRKTHSSTFNPNDPPQALVVKFKEQSGSLGQFVQSIRLVPDPAVVLFNETQLIDIEQFCGSLGKSKCSWS